MSVTDEAEDALLVDRVAGIDVGKTQIEVCVRTPGAAPGRRRQEVRTFATMTRDLLACRDWLAELGVQLVVMESTGDYWKPVFYLLEDDIERVWLLNAAEVKALPGRPKTDRRDAVWLAKVAERGMARPSFVPPRPIRRLRMLTRYRRSLTGERTREKQRVEKILEDAQIKLSVVASDIFGVSGRDMLAALIAGQRDAKVLAGMARGRLQNKIPALEEALTGHFGDEHAFVVAMMLEHIDQLSARIDQLTAKIDEVVAPFAHQVDQLDEITGVGHTAAQDLIAEIGVDMSVFPTAAHLVSWAKRAPTIRQSGGKKANGGPTGRGNQWLGGTLGEISLAASRTKNTFLGQRYRRLARRRGKRKALVAVENSVLTIAWHLLSDPQARFSDLGADHYLNRVTRQHRTRELARQLTALTGQHITVNPDGKISIHAPATAAA